MIFQNRLIDTIYDNLEDPKININQFYEITKSTITDIYRINAYIEQLTYILKRLRKLLSIYDNTENKDRKTESYANLLNDIAIELQYLKATDEAMDDNLNDINKIEGIDLNISSRIMDLKKEVRKIIYKAEKIIAL